MSDLIGRLNRALAGRYEVDGELGRGATGTVFSSTDIRHQRAVAIKVLKPEVADAIGVERFLREIRTAASLSHPNILPLFDSGDADGLLYYVTPLIDGESLKERLQRDGPFSVEAARKVACEIADALSYAHRRSIVHRDIKPANILFSEGHAVVADFGIAKALNEADDGLTASGMTLGTPAYMSPEQADRVGEPGPASDLYSLGCVLFELLTGEPPFTGANARTTIARLLVETPPRVSTLRPTVPDAIDTAVDRALQKIPSDRFQTADEMAAVLSAPTDPKWTRSVSSARRRRSLGAGVALFAGGAIAFVLWPAGPLLEERDLVLVADFDSTLEEEGLSAAFREAVTAGLDQSGYVRTVSRRDVTSMMRLAQIPETTRLGIGIARQLAERNSIRAIVAGTLAPLDQEQFSATVHLLDGEDGVALLSVARSGPDLLAIAEQLTSDLREGIGEKPAVVAATAPVRSVMTPSLEAFRLYLDGLSQQQSGNPSASNKSLAQALEIDSGFAAARITQGTNYLTLRLSDSAAAVFDLALKDTTRLVPEQRYRVRGYRALLNNDPVEALRWYDLFLEEQPDNVDGLNNRSQILALVGRYDETMRDLERSVSLNPFGDDFIQLQLLNLATAHVINRRDADAAKTIQRINRPLSMYAEIMAAIALNNWSEVWDLAEIGSGTEMPVLVRVMALSAGGSHLAAQGQIEEANETFRHARSEYGGQVGRWFAFAELLVAQVHGVAGPGVPAAIDSTLPPNEIVLRGLAALAEGDTTLAGEAIGLLRALPDAAQATGSGLAFLEANRHARAGRWNDVIEVLSRPVDRGEHDHQVIDRVGNFAMRWLLADAFDAIQQPDSAAEVLHSMLDERWMPSLRYPLRGVIYLEAHSRLSEYYRRQGDPDRAAHHSALSDQLLVRSEPSS